MEFQGAFYILGIGLVTAAIVFSIEHVTHAKCGSRFLTRDFHNPDDRLTKRTRWSLSYENDVYASFAAAVMHLALPVNQALTGNGERKRTDVSPIRRRSVPITKEESQTLTTHKDVSYISDFEHEARRSLDYQSRGGQAQIASDAETGEVTTIDWYTDYNSTPV